MKIQTNDFFSNSQSNTDNPVIQKLFNQLAEGDRFMATIVDIKPDSVSLRLSDNTIVNAKSLFIPEARIGQEAVFLVKENSSDQIFLEMEKQSGTSVTSNFAKELLISADIPATKENIKLINAMIENNLPLDKESLQKAIFFKYSDKESAIDKILFLLKENFPAEPLSVKTLNHIMESKTTLKNDLYTIADKAANLPEGEFKDEILKLFDINKEIISKNNGSEKNTNLHNEQIFNKILDKLFIKIKDRNSLEDLSEQFNKIYNTAKKGKEISENADDAKSSLKTIFENIQNNIDFMKHINNYKEFLQIPININQNPEQCEIYVFKDKGKKNNLKESASILISLDLTFLGRIETFIDKSFTNLVFQFKIEKDNILKLFENNTGKLSKMMKEKGYTISSISFKTIDEPFNILKDMNSTEKNKNDNKRYSFDMRV